MSSSMTTMRDVAREAGVSRTTVSFVLNARQEPSIRIPEETRRRVLDVAEAMGYRQNDLVRAVVSGKSRMLGFMGFHARYESAARILDSALKEAEARGYTIKVLPVDKDHISDSAIQQCVNLRLAGVIALNPGGRNLDNLRSEMTRFQIPVVLSDDSLPQDWGIRVASDDRQGISLAVEHLAGLGHRRIAFMGGHRAAPISVIREAGFREAMARLKLPVAEGFVGYSNWDNDVIAQQTRRFTQELSATAVACLTDETAMVVMRSVRQLGFQVPRDVSVVGYADLSLAQLADPPLTTVAQPFEAMGHAIVRNLVERIEHKEGGSVADPFEEMLSTHLVVRGSTAPLSTAT